MGAVGELTGAYLSRRLVHEIDRQAVDPVVAAPAAENDLRADGRAVFDRSRQFVWFHVELRADLRERGVVPAHEREAGFAALQSLGQQGEEFLAQLGGHRLRAVSHADVGFLYLADQPPFFPCEGMPERAGGGRILVLLEQDGVGHGIGLADRAVQPDGVRGTDDVEVAHARRGEGDCVRAASARRAGIVDDARDERV